MAVVRVTIGGASEKTTFEKFPQTNSLIFLFELAEMLLQQAARKQRRKM
jgi:hypothetical protein